jgi:hypothetical protein
LNKCNDRRCGLLNVELPTVYTENLGLKAIELPKVTVRAVVVPSGNTAETRADTSFVTESCPSILSVAVIGEPEFGVNVALIGTLPGLLPPTPRTTMTRRFTLGAAPIVIVPNVALTPLFAPIVVP